MWADRVYMHLKTKLFLSTEKALQTFSLTLYVPVDSAFSALQIINIKIHPLDG